MLINMFEQVELKSIKNLAIACLITNNVLVVGIRIYIKKDALNQKEACKWSKLHYNIKLLYLMRPC